MQKSPTNSLFCQVMNHATCGVIIPTNKFQLRRFELQSCSPWNPLSNGISNFFIKSYLMFGFLGFWVVVVGNQIANLISNQIFPPFNFQASNLQMKNANPLLISILQENFQWLKLNKLMYHFCYLKFYSKGPKHYKTLTLTVGKPHGSVGTHFHTLVEMYLSFQKFQKLSPPFMP